MKLWLPGMFLACFLISALYGDSAPADLHPDPKLSPQEVVEFQLAALRANDVPTADAGIGTTGHTIGAAEAGICLIFIWVSSRMSVVNAVNSYRLTYCGLREPVGTLLGFRACPIHFNINLDDLESAAETRH